MPIRLATYKKGLHLGRTAYLDANFLISVVDISLGRPPEPKLIFKELLKQKVTLLVSPLAIDEAWWTLLTEWNKAEGRGNIRENLKKKPDLFLDPYLPKLRTFMEKIARWPQIEWIDISCSAEVGPQMPGLFNNALLSMSKFGLMPRDAIHVECAFANSADSFITSDPDFDRLDGVRDSDLLVVRTP